MITIYFDCFRNKNVDLCKKRKHALDSTLSQMEKKKCFIHYPQLSLKNENKLIDVSENSFETIHRAKSARIELGDKHFHKI